MFEKKTFNHDCDDFIEALGYTESDQKHVYMTITFETLKPHVLASTLFTGEDEIPDGFSSKSKVFEQCILHYQSNPDRTALTYLLFEIIYRKLKNQLQNLHGIIERAEDKKIEKRSFEKLEDMIKDIVETMKTKKVYDMIQFIKECKMDYTKFMAKAFMEDFDGDDIKIKIAQDGQLNEYKDIDDLLSNLMDQEEDED